MHRITILPQQVNIQAADGQQLLDALRSAGYAIAAPCGGNGTCGKCKVTVDGKEVSACQTLVDRDMTVLLPREENTVILTEGIAASLPADSGLCLAVDIGTTTVTCTACVLF